MSRINDGGRHASPVRVTAATPPNTKRKVLVVDDEKDIVDLVAYNLGRNGYDTIVATNGNQALEWPRKMRRPDHSRSDASGSGRNGSRRDA